MTLCQVLPEYLKRTLGHVVTDPFVSACLPEVAAAMRPLLPQLQPKAAQLLSHVALAATQTTKLDEVLQKASQVPHKHMSECLEVTMDTKAITVEYGH